MRTVSNYAKRELEKKKKLALNFNKRQKIIPVAKWGQNFTHVLVYVKFAHRFGSPGSNDNWGTQVKFEDHRLHVNTLGLHGDMPVEFELDIPLFARIEPEQSHYSSESAGSIVVKMRKGEDNKIWRDLVDKEYNKDKLTLKIWWELADVYEEPMKKYNRMIDAEDDEKDRVSFFIEFF